MTTTWIGFACYSRSRSLLSTYQIILRFQIPGIIPELPGVPAFYFISSFLIIDASYLNAPGAPYFQNRFLRLYPGLVCVTLGGAAMTLLAYGWSDLFNRFPTYVIWFIAQTTLVQDYNPPAFRDVGVGVVNGSLWTITVKIVFYFCVPIIVRMEGRFRFTVLMLMALSFGVFAIGPKIWIDNVYRDKTFYDVLALTPIAWGWMFGFGILAVKHIDFVRRWMRYFPLAIVPLTTMITFGGGEAIRQNGQTWIVLFRQLRVSGALVRLRHTVL